MAVVGSQYALFLDGTQQIYAASETTIAKGVGSVWIVVGSGYMASGRWRFALYGDDLIATDFVDVVQMAHGSGGTFAALGGSPPRAKIVEAVNNFVFLLNTNVATNQWWCSGLGADAIWTPDVATQSANGLLTETEGPLNAGKKLGVTLVAYKLKSMYVAQYLGPPLIWTFQLVSSSIGTFGQESVVALGDRHVFPATDNFYSYDGGAPRELVMPSSTREFFFEDSLDVANADKIIGRWDRRLEVVTWHYPSKSAFPAGTLDMEIKWHVPTNKWTLKKRPIEYVMLPEMPSGSGITYDQFGSYFTTYGENIPITYEDILFTGTTTYVQGVFLLDHRLYTLTGTPGVTSFLTGDWGDETMFTYVRRIKPKFAHVPADATSTTLTEYFKTNLGDATTTGATVVLAAQNWFNLRRRAHFHRYQFVASGDYEIIGFEPDVIMAGKR